MPQTDIVAEYDGPHFDAAHFERECPSDVVRQDECHADYLMPKRINGPIPRLSIGKGQSSSEQS